EPSRGRHGPRGARPGRHRRQGVLGAAVRGPHRDPAHHVLRRVAVPVAGRRRDRLRPGGRGAGSAGGAPDGPGRPAGRGRHPAGRGRQRHRAGRPGPGADRGVPRQRGRRHHEPGPGVPGGQRRRPRLAGRPPVRGAAPLRPLRAQLVRRRGGLAGRRGGPGRGHLHRLHVRAGRGRPRRRADRRGQRRRGHRGRHRRADLPDHRGLLRRGQGDHAAQRRPGARVATVRRQPQRLRARRGRRGVRAGGAAARPGPRCPGLRRDRRLRDPVQRLPHDRPAPGRCRDGRGDPGRPGPRPAGPAGRRLRQRARLGHQAERPARDGRVQAQPRRARPPGPDQLDQVDGRPLARRHRVHRAGRVHAGHDPPRGAAHGEPARARPRVRPGLRAAGRPAAPHGHGAQRRQRLRRFPVGGRAGPARPGRGV
ncbi:MAG: Polyketide beta-ketoacyl synthase WhiE-KS paralog, partial [uncultured Corynebacteriales bacterium]